jgi:hypothetical protein
MLGRGEGSEEGWRRKLSLLTGGSSAVAMLAGLWEARWLDGKVWQAIEVSLIFDGGIGLERVDGLAATGLAHPNTPGPRAAYRGVPSFLLPKSSSSDNLHLCLYRQLLPRRVLPHRSSRRWERTRHCRLAIAVRGRSLRVDQGGIGRAADRRIPDGQRDCELLI